MPTVSPNLARHTSRSWMRLTESGASEQFNKVMSLFALEAKVAMAARSAPWDEVVDVQRGVTHKVSPLLASTFLLSLHAH